ncbi:hypothetical protein AB9N12_13145 [Bacteroides sp. AN502(2024)]|uniref:hypothetical protein n=1 Tax=Bacteroides sp. AN502(2024) TaxID=3160599 RepID=UPI003517172F
MKRITMLISLWLLFFPNGGQEMAAQIRNKVCDTIPYEFIQEKIIIPVTVNGVNTKYIVDTGGRTGTMYDAAMKMNATAAGYMRVSDVNAQSSNYQEAYVQDITIGKNYQIKQLKTMVLPKDPFFAELGVAGILGGDAFAQSVVTFDSRSKIMVINYPYRPERLKVTDGIPLLNETEHYSVVNVRLGDHDLRVLFDTGAGGFLLYSTEDYNNLADISKVTNHGYGIVAAGITGLGNPVDIKKITVPSINIMGKEFTNVGSTTTVMNETIIGVDLLTYGKVIIDYMRKRFYFFPFEEGKTDMGGAPALWNVSILPRNERFEITTIWDSMKDKVAFGDEVININGTSLKDCPMSQMAVEEIMNAIPGDTGYIIIKKDNQEKRIEIKKEK